MKKLLLTIILTGNSILMLAQNVRKPHLDTSVFNKWPMAGAPVMSNDGNYVLYAIYNQPVESTTLVIKTITENWKMEIPGLSSASFTDDSRHAIYINTKDSLCLLSLGSSSVEYISHVSSFRLFRQDGNEWLAYQLNTPTKDLVFRNIGTGLEKPFSGVMDYVLSNSGNKLVLETETNNDAIAVQLMSFPDGKSTMIWKGSNASGFVFDATETQLAFVVDSGMSAGKENGKSIFYYREGAEKPVLLADDQSTGIDSGLQISNISSGFSKDGKRLLISLTEKAFLQPGPNAVMVDIWSYTDGKLQSQQLKELATKNYMAILDIDGHRIIRLQQENETIQLFTTRDNGIIPILTSVKGDGSERNWNTASYRYDFIVSINNGTRKQIEIKGTKSLYDKHLSPTGKYLVGINFEQGDYLSYDLATGITRNLTHSLPIPLIDTEFDEPDRKYRGLSFGAWLDDERSVLMYDKYDIWQIDLRGISLPVNLTNGYGRKYNIVFRLAVDYTGRTISNSENLILTAFNRTNKQSGFFRKILNGRADPELLIMGPYVYSLYSLFNRPKSREGDIYLISRSSSSESINYFYTTDFKRFTPITNVYPEKNYNWLTSELLTWKTFDGHNEQGILYKPENFDPKKKYPVILYYYEKMSDGLYNYEKPEASLGWINIPWFVSNGYLVFTPDIHYKIGEPGQSVYNSVVAAAKYLSKFPWVNASKMGIAGHSFGGYETNYLITHTNMFAAAISAAGSSNMTSEYGSLSHGGRSKQHFYELSQFRIGASLWQRPDLFLKNSPIFRADKVMTPLLMMHNKGDGAIPFAQGVEFFTALRRLGKTVWMLQYDGEVHAILSETARIDYTIRTTQFFDHYLKAAPAPKWMTQGINVKFKGIDSGFELDYSNKTPGPGLLVDDKDTKEKMTTGTKMKGN